MMNVPDDIHSSVPHSRQTNSGTVLQIGHDRLQNPYILTIPRSLI